MSQKLSLISSNKTPIKTPNVGSYVNFIINETEFDLNKRLHLDKKVRVKGVVKAISKTALGRVYSVSVKGMKDYQRVGISQIYHVWYVVDKT